jgi:hypothetical protein
MQIGTYLNSNCAMKSVCVILFNYLVIASQEMVCIPKPTGQFSLEFQEGGYESNSWNKMMGLLKNTCYQCGFT